MHSQVKSITKFKSSLILFRYKYGVHSLCSVMGGLESPDPQNLMHVIDNVQA